jgi:hypothetical protein
LTLHSPTEIGSMPKLSSTELAQVCELLADLKEQNQPEEPIVIISWVVAGSNEPSYEDCFLWQTTDMDGSNLEFNRAVEESMVQFRDRVGTELEAMSCQEAGEPRLFCYSLRPDRD